MEIIPGLTINLSLIIGIMVKIAMILMLILSFVMIRQESLMDRVVNFSIGGSLKMLVWLYCGMSLLFTVIVIVA